MEVKILDSLRKKVRDGDSVGRAFAWEVRSRGFESHLRKLIFP